MIAKVENSATFKLLLTLAEAAEAMSVCERTISRLIARRELKPIKVGPRGVRVSVRELEAWIARKSQEAASE